jgi:hypothetical protein
MKTKHPVDGIEPRRPQCEVWRSDQGHTGELRRSIGGSRSGCASSVDLDREVTDDEQWLVAEERDGTTRATGVSLTVNDTPLHL